MEDELYQSTIQSTTASAQWLSQQNQKRARALVSRGSYSCAAAAPKRIRSGQLYTEGARGTTPSGTRRARGKLVSVFSCNMGTLSTLFPSLAPPRNAKVRPWRPNEGCQDGC